MYRIGDNVVVSDRSVPLYGCVGTILRIIGDRYEVDFGANQYGYHTIGVYQQDSIRIDDLF